MMLEVVPLAVTDVDRSLAFYRDQVGFTLDVDYQPTPAFRVVQLTPPGSTCSVQLVTGDTRIHGLYLVTADLAATHAALRARGVAVGPIRHKTPVDAWSGDYVPGLDSSRRDYASFADLTDPDGNMWTLQERGARP
jgi:catechol 2,3-dioxygenase-like lactoylglutathione lyase family enzyme